MGRHKGCLCDKCEIQREQQRKWYEKNRSQYLAKCKAHYAANREAIRARRRALYRANRIKAQQIQQALQNQ